MVLRFPWTVRFNSQNHPCRRQVAVHRPGTAFFVWTLAGSTTALCIAIDRRAFLQMYLQDGRFSAITRLITFMQPRPHTIRRPLVKATRPDELLDPAQSHAIPYGVAHP